MERIFSLQPHLAVLVPRVAAALVDKDDLVVLLPMVQQLNNILLLQPQHFFLGILVADMVLRLTPKNTISLVPAGQGGPGDVNAVLGADLLDSFFQGEEAPLPEIVKKDVSHQVKLDRSALWQLEWFGWVPQPVPILDVLPDNPPSSAVLANA